MWGRASKRAGRCQCCEGSVVGGGLAPVRGSCEQLGWGLGGGGPSPPPLKRWGQIFFRTFGKSKIFSGASGAH